MRRRGRPACIGTSDGWRPCRSTPGAASAISCGGGRPAGCLLRASAGTCAGPSRRDHTLTQWPIATSQLGAGCSHGHRHPPLAAAE
jgi:hypothetical protein